MNEIILGRKTPPIDWRGVPFSYYNKVSAVCRTLAECDDLVYWFGDAEFCPYLPVLVQTPAGWTAIAGMGFATAAELRDCAVSLWERHSESMEKRGTIFDFDTLRERRGLADRDKAGAAWAEAIEERIRKHKASPRTDPFRQPQYVRPNERVLFAVDGTRDVFKENIGGNGNAGNDPGADSHGEGAGGNR